MESTLERVQLSAKAKFGCFVVNTYQHFPSSHCHTYYFAGLWSFLTVTSTFLHQS